MQMCVVTWLNVPLRKSFYGIYVMLSFFFKRPPSLFRRLMGVMKTDSTTKSTQSLNSEQSDSAEPGYRLVWLHLDFDTCII